MELKKVDEYLEAADDSVGRDHTVLIEYARKALDLLSEYPDKYRESRALTRLGVGYFSDGQVYESLSVYEQALRLQKETGDIAGEAVTNVNIGLVFSLGGEFDIAMDYLERGRIIAHVQHFEETEAMACDYTGEVFYKMERYEDAEEFHARALYIYSKLNHERGMCLSQLNLAHDLRRQQRFSEANAYFNKTIRLTEAHQLDVYKGMALLDHAEYLVESHLLDDAREAVDRVFPILTEKGGRLSLSRAYLILGRIYYGKEEFRKSTESCRIALKFAEEANQREEAVDIMRLLADIIGETGECDDYREAYYYAKKATHMQKRLFNEKNALKLSVVRAHYDLEIFQLKNVELEKLNEDLKIANAQKDKFFSIIAHDLLNPLSGIEGLTRHISTNLEEMESGEIREIMNQLHSTSMRTSDLLKNLLDWSRSQNGELTLFPGHIDAQSIVNDAVDVFQDIIQRKEITVVVKIREEIALYADRNTLYSVFLNLISNSTKFTERGGHLMISIEKKGGVAVIKISDNGVGMDYEKQKQLFSPAQIESTQGTEGERGNGIGLLICRDFVEKNGGSIQLESREGEGTTFTISLPLA